MVEKGGRNGYMTERKGRNSWEWQGIVTFCTCQRMNANGMPNFVGPAELNLLHITLLIPRIFRQLLDFWKMCALLKDVLDKWERRVSHFQSAFNWYNFQAHSHSSKKSPLPSSYMSVCLSICQDIFVWLPLNVLL